MTGERLSRVRVDELDTAARRMMDTALRLQHGQDLVVLADRYTSRLGDAVARAGLGAGARLFMCWLDDLGPRPLRTLPEQVHERLQLADASVFVASDPHDELPMRQQLLHRVRVSRLRHAHLPGISTLAFARGMRVDYDEIAERGRGLLARLAGAPMLAAASPGGTALRVHMAEGSEWYPQLGEIVPGRWGNLPAGALFATPESVHGVFVADAALGHQVGRRSALAGMAPVTFTIRDGRVVDVGSAHAELERDVEELLQVGSGSDRVGLVSLGVNFGLGEPTGEAIVDQNLPGLHLAIGDPAARVTGASWSAPTSLAACQAGATVTVGREPLVRDGKLVQPS